MTTPGQQGAHKTNTQIRRSLADASRAWSDFEATMQVYQANVQRRQFDAADAERLRLTTLLEEYLDQYALAGRLAHQLSSSGDHP